MLDSLVGLMPFSSVPTNVVSPKTADRRNKISKSFFKKILSRDSCLHSLLPPERNTEVLSKLRMEVSRWPGYKTMHWGKFQPAE